MNQSETTAVAEAREAAWRDTHWSRWAQSSEAVVRARGEMAREVFDAGFEAAIRAERESPQDALTEDVESLKWDLSAEPSRPDLDAQYVIVNRESLTRVVASLEERERPTQADALERYGQHLYDCAVAPTRSHWDKRPEECTCGLQAALDGVASSGQPYESVGSSLVPTDEMVERAAEAIWRRDDSFSRSAGATMPGAFRDVARAALRAAFE